MGVYFNLFKQSLYQPKISWQFAITYWQKKIPLGGIYKNLLKSGNIIAYCVPERSEGALVY